MARRLTVDDKLAAIRRVRDQPASAESTAELQINLGDKSNLVVAAAAQVVGEQGLVALSAELERAFPRFLVDPLKDDKLCRAKVAVIRALDKLEHNGAEVFRTAAHHVQHEPVWNGSEDTAAPLRAAALFALARVGDSFDLPLLVDSLTDPECEVRVSAAQSLSCFRSESTSLLLRFKVNVGDKEPDVIAECFLGLLGINAKAHLPFVLEFLDSADAGECEAAVLALGRSRLPEAFDALRSRSERAMTPALRQHVLLAIAMLRLPAAIEFLLELLASESDSHALAALTALKIYHYDPRLVERIEAVVRKQGSSALRARFDRDFPKLT